MQTLSLKLLKKETNMPKFASKKECNDYYTKDIGKMNTIITNECNKMPSDEKKICLDIMQGNIHNAKKAQKDCNKLP